MQISSYLDATILNPSARKEEFQLLCRDAIHHQFPAVCVPPFMVEDCKDWLQNSKVSVATVVGFPTGNHTVDIKLAELTELIYLGADEIDYVIHRGYLSSNQYEKLEDETKEWIEICRTKNVISKWIIEASELDSAQLDKCIELANRYHPDYVKTSTGVYGRANLDQVIYLRKNLKETIKIKAAGGISDRETAERFVSAGANRLGVSQYSAILEQCK